MYKKLLLLILFISLIIYYSIFEPENNEHMIDSKNLEKDQINVTINLDKQFPHWNYYSYPYSWMTPFIWNNPTRFPKWWYPPYTYITNYYRYYDYY